MLALGLPSGLPERLESRSYGPGLTVHVIDRYDHIHLKLLAIAENVSDREKHMRDLERLEPTAEEILAAARWAMETIDRRLSRSQMILREALLRNGTRARRPLSLATPRRPVVSPRDRLGRFLLGRPGRFGRLLGRLYGNAIHAGGAVRRTRTVLPSDATTA